MIRRINLSLLGLLFSLTVVLPAAARDEYTRHFDKTIRMSSGEGLRLEHTFGSVTIRTHSGPDAVIHADIRVSASDASQAKQYADQVEIEIESSSQLSIRTKYPNSPKSFFGMRNVSFAAQYEITVPENTPLTIRNSFSEVSVTGVKANCDIVTSHAQLSFDNGRGTQRLEDSFAKIELSHNAGNVTVEDSNGAIDASDVAGSLTVRNRFAALTLARVSNGLSVINSNGSIDVSDSGGAGDIRNSFGNVSVENYRGDIIVNNANGKIDVASVRGSANLRTTFANISIDKVSGNVIAHANNSQVSANQVGGSLNVVNSFGAVNLADIRRDVQVESGNGAVTLEKIGGPAHVKTSFGMVQADGVNGHFSVENSNGSVKASSIKGADVTTSFGSVSLDDVAGPIQVNNQNGSVDVTNSLRGSCAPIAVHTSFSAVRVHLPDDASYRVAAKTSFGRIHSDFPMTVSGSLSNDDISGTIGGGRCDLRISDSNGSIEILKGGS
ncbi:MAG TPA: hypothetical protein VHZ55_27100 [Bryobacteraceae bacterium]|nr:hypothetical protein [Bryobacteraceae bacterium]